MFILLRKCSCLIRIIGFSEKMEVCNVEQLYTQEIFTQDKIDEKSYVDAF